MYNGDIYLNSHNNSFTDFITKNEKLVTTNAQKNNQLNKNVTNQYLTDYDYNSKIENIIKYYVSFISFINLKISKFICDSIKFKEMLKINIDNKILSYINNNLEIFTALTKFINNKINNDSKSNTENERNVSGDFCENIYNLNNEFLNFLNIERFNNLRIDRIAEFNYKGDYYVNKKIKELSIDKQKLEKLLKDLNNKNKKCIQENSNNIKTQTTQIKNVLFQNDANSYKNQINDLIAENKRIKLEIEVRNSELKEISEKLKNTEKIAEKTLLTLKNNGKSSINISSTKKNKHGKFFDSTNIINNINNNTISKTKNWLNSSLNDINNTIFSSLNTMENSNFNKIPNNI